VFDFGSSCLIERIASRNGRLSISPTVPPISIIKNSFPSAAAKILFFISSTT